jgi:hypothetical protein
VICRYFKPSSGLEPETPPYHALRSATGRNRWQRFWLIRAVSEARAFATGCHWLRPLGSMNAPSSSPESLMRKRIQRPRSHRPEADPFHIERGSCSSRSGRKPAQARGRSRSPLALSPSRSHSVTAERGRRHDAVHDGRPRAARQTTTTAGDTPRSVYQAPAVCAATRTRP